MRVDEEGSLEIVDPGFDAVPLLRSLDPRFRVRTGPLPGFAAPRFLALRKSGCGLLKARLEAMGEDDLWAVHEKALTGPFRPCWDPDEATLLDLKIELARRLLAPCRLCGRRCGVDRLRGERGLCGLGPEALIAEHYVHIAEEPAINPSHILSLYGCGLGCRFCQQSHLLDTPPEDSEPLSPQSLSGFDLKGARSFSFMGGNPDESLYGILSFLCGLPDPWRLPLVWNSNAYGTEEALNLLDGVVDAYVPDFKFFSEDCANALSSAPDYPRLAVASISKMLGQGVPVIVRILVLPGHNDCCHFPGLTFLANQNQSNLFVSLRGQYCPDGWITEMDGPLSRRSTRDEIAAVQEKATALGLATV